MISAQFSYLNSSDRIICVPLICPVDHPSMHYGMSRDIVHQSIGKTNGILAQPMGNTTPNTGPGSLPVLPAGGCPSPLAIATAPEGGGNLPCGSQSGVTRKGAAWTGHSGALRLKAQRCPRAIASGRPVWKAGGKGCYKLPIRSVIPEQAHE
jgi:hypothetical protein